MNYVRRDWIVQRLAGVDASGDQWEDFRPYVYSKKSQADMERAIERLQGSFPAEEFRGHNIAYCACHATGLKRYVVRTE